MNLKTILALVLIVAGVLGLIYGGFRYTRERHDVKLGPVKLEIKDRERFEVPVWAAAASVGVGTVLLLIDRRR